MTNQSRQNAIMFLREMSRVTLAMKSYMRQKFKAHNVDITFEMLQVLRFLWEKESSNQQEIATAINKDKASLTYLLDNLGRRNLVQRTEDSQDRRNKIITLTRKGWELESLITPWLEEMYVLIAQNSTEEDLVASLQTFERICNNIQNKVE